MIKLCEKCGGLFELSHTCYSIIQIDENQESRIKNRESRIENHESRIAEYKSKD